MRHFALWRYHAKTPRKDQVDRLLALEVYSVTAGNTALALCSMLLYVYSVLMEIYSCYSHLLHSSLLNTALVTTHTFLCHLIINTLSLSWYIEDSRKDDRPRVSLLEWLLRYIFHILPFGPVVRYCTMIKYVVLGSRAHPNWGELVLEEHHNTTLLCFFKSLLVNSPHILLNINLQACSHHHLQLKSVLLLLYAIQMAWAIAMHHRALRACNESKKDISWAGTFCQAVWRAGTLISRFLSLGVFSCSHWPYFLGGCAVHWGLLTLWSCLRHTTFCPSTVGEWLFKPVLGLVHMVCYFNPSHNKPTFWLYVLFYGLVGCENMACVLLWYFSQAAVGWPHNLVLACVPASFVLGLTAMVLYYCQLHPSGNLSVKMRMSSLFTSI